MPVIPRERKSQRGELPDTGTEKAGLSSACRVTRLDGHNRRLLRQCDDGVVLGTMQLELLDTKAWQTRDELANAIFEGTIRTGAITSEASPRTRLSLRLPERELPQGFPVCVGGPSCASVLSPRWVPLGSDGRHAEEL
jgi:hypothetical protein